LPGPIAGFQWGAFSTGQTVNVPFAETLTALDSRGFIANFTGTVNITGMTPGSGNTFVNVPVTPASATLVNGVWTGSLTVLQSANNVHLHADDGNGHLGDSSTFNVVPASSAAPALIVNNGDAQRSMVTVLTVTFADPVTLASGALTLATLGGTSISFDQTMKDSKTYAMTFPNGPGHSVADGQYIVTVHAAAVIDTVGSGITQDVQFGFYRLYGDFLGDGHVSFNDLVQLIQAFGKGVGSSEYQADMDVNANGVINMTELAALVQNFNKGLSAPIIAPPVNNSARSAGSVVAAARTNPVVASTTALPVIAAQPVDANDGITPELGILRASNTGPLDNSNQTLHLSDDCLM
jgi:hypothetical protein